MDFLLSLSPKAKEKLANVKAQNKSVMYQEHVPSEEDVSGSYLKPDFSWSCSDDFRPSGHWRPRGPLRSILDRVLRGHSFTEWLKQSCLEIRTGCVGRLKAVLR